MIEGHQDGPSNTLINFIKEEGVNIKEWKGYRELTDK